MKDKKYNPQNTTLVDSLASAADPVTKRLGAIENVIHKKLDSERQSAFKRFPKLFTILTALGVASFYYGFETTLDQVAFIYSNSWILFFLGLAILIATGMLYKKL